MSSEMTDILQHLKSERDWCDRIIAETTNCEIGLVMIGWRRGLNEAIDKMDIALLAAAGAKA